VRRRTAVVVVATLFSVLALAASATDTAANVAVSSNNVLWKEPSDLSTRNLLYGAGGKEHAPAGTTMTFEKEEKKGSNPKIVVRDQDGTKWTLKFGREAQPETAATRLLWAVGYFTDDDYFVPELRIENLPKHLARGGNFIKHGVAKNVRLERHRKGEEHLGEWKWRQNVFEHTREFNGLRVMMALINNWDLNDNNNGIYQEKDSPEKIYLVKDVGSSFGTTGHSWIPSMQKGNLHYYSGSKFISSVKPGYVDFNVPTRPAWINFFNIYYFIKATRLRWIGKHVPREDAKWVGSLLAQLSPEQIRDAFRAAGYSSGEVEGFAKTVEKRIAQLKAL
jgi:hypothetical protein